MAKKNQNNSVDSLENQNDVYGNISTLVEKIKSGELKIGDALDKIEAAILIDVIQHANHNNTQASRLLGINRTTFIMKLRKLRSMGIDPKLYELSDKLF